MIQILPRDIPSAVSDIEASKLIELSQDKKVLELGAHFGFSTVVLAKAAAKLDSVDWHQGDSMAGHGESALIYWQNLKRYGVAGRVVTHIGRFEDVLPTMKSGAFDGIFLDGEHDLASVRRDIGLCHRLVKMGGWLAFHDYGRFEVHPAVDQWATVMGYNVEVFDTLAVTRIS